ncbi:amino acid ABC transporter permease [Listeria monocytogenes]|uniref:amino acid ABC transporter permease n=1 Tax=Listeria monocytogenes TaxID=1639 RepID=UPI001F58CF99|nr:amino acid ABC transporter permease [Listeria monocytogenes]
MDKAFDVKMIADFIPTLAGYLPITLYILALSLIFGFIPRIYKVPILDQFARVYISFFRGTPIMVQLFIVFYGIPALSSVFGIDLSQMDPLYAAIATYALSSAATIAEVIRAGVNSVDAGQAEAAYSIGLSSRQTFLRIILPQALYQALPNFGNLVIGYLKDTSLAFSIGVMDMSGRGQTLITLSNHALEVYISLSIIYYLTAVLLEYSFKWIEKRVKKENTRFTSIFDIEL